MKFALCNEMFENRPMAEVCSTASRLEAIKDIGWDQWLSVEVFKYDPDPETIARASIECLRSYF